MLSTLPDIVMAYIVMADIVTACIVIGCIAMTHIVMAYIVMACIVVYLARVHDVLGVDSTLDRALQLDVSVGPSF